MRNFVKITFSMKHINHLITALTSFVITSSAAASNFEGAFYGTNYTAPFAHSFRALKSQGVDPKSAIDCDVYHMSRLGLNAFRLHLWDVELSDSIGNLLDNEHLDCLDYLISKLEERNIAIVLTAQTNFGNGYPERNTNPNNAYSYLYDKCDVHDNPDAIKAQERYISLLVKHVNHYTGKSFCADKNILGIEINNEPCHSGDKKAITSYVNKMIKALKKAGWHKDIFYNVSHNLDRTSAFFDAPINGATFQWYPTGLVSGHQLKGNFLPFVDDYNIPFDSLNEKNHVARIVYEFDPADNLYSYLYPAAARTFRAAGFQWITQFAYDPIDIAWANTEYQTHYLNLAYTPAKALGMMIAAEIVRQTPAGTNLGKYPQNTKFGNFTIDARNDVAMLNSDTTYIYTNTTTVNPLNNAALKHIAGHGSSPIINYDGSGAYFLDKLDANTWRLEIMPDVVLTKDPFEKPSLKRKVAEIIYNSRNMKIDLASLGSQYFYKQLKNAAIETASNGNITVSPGVYLLSEKPDALNQYSGTEIYADGTKRVGEYVAPAPSVQEPVIVHTPAKYAKAGSQLSIKATVLGNNVDSVVIYPSHVSFWRNDNHLIKMNSCGYQQYEATVQLGDMPMPYSYNIVAYRNGEATTYPSQATGTPLDWDFADGAISYTTNVYRDGDPLNLLVAKSDLDNASFAAVADSWHGTRFSFEQRAPLSQDFYTMSVNRDADADIVLLSKDISEIIASRQPGDDLSSVKVKLGNVHGFKNLYVGFVTKDGFTFKADLNNVAGVQTFNFDSLILTSTINPRNVYPVFINRIYTPQSAVNAKFDINDVDRLVIVGERENSHSDASAEIFGVTIDK